MVICRNGFIVCFVQITVYESLVYSASLRFDRDVEQDIVLAFVQEVQCIAFLHRSNQGSKFVNQLMTSSVCKAFKHVHLSNFNYTYTTTYYKSMI